MSKAKRFLVLSLIVISIALLVPGVIGPMFTLRATLDKAELTTAATTMVVDAMVKNETSAGSEKPEGEIRAAAEQRVKMMMSMFQLDKQSGEFEAYSKTRSILGTVRELWERDARLVAFLVMLFSVIIPVTKMLLILVGTFTSSISVGRISLGISGAISKWSMADVFVVAIFVAYLAASAKPPPEDELERLISFYPSFEWGFYAFVGYCIFSVASAQLVGKPKANP